MAFLITAAIASCQARWRSGNHHSGPRKLIARTLTGLLLLLLAAAGIAEAQSRAEYQIKAAYLYNFGKFVEWPSRAFSGPSDPFRICILGESPFDPDLERTFSSREIKNRPVRVIFPDSVAQARKCHILFLSPSESSHMRTILSDLASNAVLTVADAPGFIHAGGMICFVLEDDGVRFEINDQPATHAGLKISSKLLVLGKRQK